MTIYNTQENIFTQKLTVAKGGGASVPNSDSNAVLVLDSASNATNFWFNTNPTADNATFGFTNDGIYYHGITYVVQENRLTITSDGAAGSPTDGLTVDGSNKVGIGTTNPTTKLEISGDVSSNSLLKVGTLEFQPYAVNNAWFGDNAYYDGSDFVRRNNGYAGLFYFQGPEGQFRFADTDSAGSTFSPEIQVKFGRGGKFGVGNNINYNTNSYTGAHFTIDDSAIVRIGDQSVDTTGQLVVGQEQGGYVGSGNHRAQFVATGTQTPIVAIGGSGSVEIWKDNGPSKASAFGGTVPGNPISDDFVFSKWNGSSWAETMRILNTNGNVGINTKNPAEKLTVSGNISASGKITILNGNSDGWNNAYTNLVYNSTAYLSGFNSTAITQNSASWNTAYTNLVNNSAAYLSGFNSTAITQNSANWNTAYTNLVNNSASYLTGASLNYVNTNFVKLSGDTMTGGLTVAGAISSSGIMTLINSTNVSTLQINGYANKGGVGYHDFASVTNTYASAVTPNKYFRLNSSGGLEIVNSNYSASLLQITDDGAINVYGTGSAKVSNNDALSGYIGFNNNNSQIYDDGNTHIHSRGSGNGMWINTNNGQLNLLAQSPVNGGSVGTGVAIGSSTLNGYVSINSSRNTAVTQPYGYLNSSGAGTTAGTSPNPYSLTCVQRVQSPEFNASSDERLKENIVPITLNDALNFVKSISAVTFNWKDPENPGKKSGYIAQQVMRAGFDHLIGIVGNNSLQEKIDSDGFVSPASAALVMNYDQVIPYHSVTIKNLLERIEKLESEIKEFKK